MAQATIKNTIDKVAYTTGINVLIVLERLESPRSRFQPGLVSTKGFFSWLVGSHFLTKSSHGLSSECAQGENDLSGVSLYKVTNPIGPGPSLMTSFNLNYIPRDPSPHRTTLGVRASGFVVD